MNNYIVTFFSHFDALKLFNFLQGMGVQAKLMPVPRKVSASCGTCLTFSHEANIDFSGYEIEALYLEVEGKFELVKEWD